MSEIEKKALVIIKAIVGFAIGNFIWLVIGVLLTMADIKIHAQNMAFALFIAFGPGFSLGVLISVLNVKNFLKKRGEDDEWFY